MTMQMSGPIAVCPSLVGRAFRPAICAALACIGLAAPSRAAAQTPTLASTTDWRRFPTVAADVASRWKPSPDTATAPVMTGTGPAVQVQTTAPATLLRTDWTLSGTYAAGATFTQAPDATPTEVGVVVGNGALACIVAPDGTARFDAHGSTLSVGTIGAEHGAATEILVRVSDKAVTCDVNGQAAVRLAPPPLTQRTASAGWNRYAGLPVTESAICRSTEMSSITQKARPCVAAIRSLPWTARSRTLARGRLSCSGSHRAPSSNDTYTPISVPA